jgi:hypothetical protein
MFGTRQRRYGRESCSGPWKDAARYGIYILQAACGPQATQAEARVGSDRAWVDRDRSCRIVRRWCGTVPEHMFGLHPFWCCSPKRSHFPSTSVPHYVITITSHSSAECDPPHYAVPVPLCFLFSPPPWDAYVKYQSLPDVADPCQLLRYSGAQSVGGAEGKVPQSVSC